MSDAASFDEWVAFVTPRLLRSAVLLTGDHHTAEDLVQNTLVRVWRHWDKVSQGYPEAYARTTMRHLQATAWRRKWKGEIPTEVLPESVAGGPDVVEDLALRQALAKLPLGMRTIVVLRLVEDLPVAEVARICECSEGNVKSQCARGAAKLRELLGGGR